MSYFGNVDLSVYLKKSHFFRANYLILYETIMYKIEENITLDKLCYDMILLIAMFLMNPQDLLNLMQVNKQLYKIIKDAEKNSALENLWSHFYKRDFQHYQCAKSTPEIKFKELYQKALIDWRTASNFSYEQRKFIRWIKSEDLDSIREHVRENAKSLFKFGKFRITVKSVLEYDSPFLTAVSDNTKCSSVMAYFFKILCEEIQDQKNNIQTKLCLAAACNLLTEVEALIELGGEVNKYWNDRMTPFHYAALYGHADIVLKLLEHHGAFVNQEIGDGRTSLFLAASKGYLTAVERLLETGADPNIEAIRGDHGYSVLSIAASNGHLPVIEKLLEHGALINGKPGGTALKPLYTAARKGHLTVVEKLLENGARPNIISPNGTTAISIAALNGHLKIVEKLLEYGAVTNFPPTVRGSSTPLYLASGQGHLDIVKILLKNGTSANQAQNNVNKSWKQWLIESVLDNDAKEMAKIYSLSPLSVAAYYGHLDVVKSLLEYGADINHTCISGERPLDIAKRKGHQQIYSLLKLWEIKNSQIERSVKRCIIAILNTCIVLPRFFNKSKNLFFGKYHLEENLVNELQKHESTGSINSEKNSLIAIIKSNKNNISLEKYEFIMEYILADSYNDKNENIISKSVHANCI